MNKIIRATVCNNEALVIACTSNDAVTQAIKYHNLSDVAAAAVGRTATIAAMMATGMKNDDDKLTITINGDGPLGQIVVSADSKGLVKAYVDHSDVHLPLTEKHKLNVGRAVGKGKLRVIKGNSVSEPYIGEVELQTGEIGDDFAYYFGISEQIPSAVGLGVLVEEENTVNVAGGFLIQLLPFASDETIDKVEKAVKGILSVTDILKNDNSPEALIQALFNEDIKIMEEKTFTLGCDCNRKRLEKVLVSLGEKELIDIINSKKPVDIQCHFCNTSYHFEIAEVQRLLNEAM